MSKKQANIAATILEKVARNSVKMAADRLLMDMAVFFCGKYC